MTKIGKYMTAEYFGDEWAVFDRSNNVLGTARWYAQWRTHVFYPTANTVLSEECLRALADWLKRLDSGRKP